MKSAKNCLIVANKKFVLVVVLLAMNVLAFAQNNITKDYTTLKGLSFGLGVPLECRDLPGMGASLNLGYDCAYPINDHFALGFYLTGGGGFWGEYQQYSSVDNQHVVFRLTAGLMMQMGDLNNRPYLLGVAPCTGLGLYDMDMVLPIEIRFGKYVTDRWYIMGELTYHYSIAKETACVEPAIRIGYNFGRSRKK